MKLTKWECGSNSSAYVTEYPQSNHQVTIAQTRFVQLTYEKSDEWLSVCSVADALIQHLQLPETIEALKIVNRPRASSASVQEIFFRGR